MSNRPHDFRSDNSHGFSRNDGFERRDDRRGDNREGNRDGARQDHRNDGRANLNGPQEPNRGAYGAYERSASQYQDRNNDRHGQNSYNSGHHGRQDERSWRPDERGAYHDGRGGRAEDRSVRPEDRYARHDERSGRPDDRHGRQDDRNARPDERNLRQDDRNRHGGNEYGRGGQGAYANNRGEDRSQPSNNHSSGQYDDRHRSSQNQYGSGHNDAGFNKQDPRRGADNYGYNSGPPRNYGHDGGNGFPNERHGNQPYANSNDRGGNYNNRGSDRPNQGYSNSHGNDSFNRNQGDGRFDRNQDGRGRGFGNDYHNNHDQGSRGFGNGQNDTRSNNFSSGNGPRRFDNDGGYDNANRSSHNDNSFGNRNNSGPGRFQNDGGYSASGGAPNNVAPVEVAPRGWMPTTRDLDELVEKTAEQVEECQISQDQAVEIRNSPNTTRLTSWENSGLHEKILRSLQRLNFHGVRAIQAAMIPQILAGYDVIGQAETSAGKTAAFGLPIVNAILNMSREERNASGEYTAPFALILAPTRELAQQIFNAIRTYANGTDITTRLSYGQQDRRQSVQEIREGCDILVGTCGRIMDLIEKQDVNMNKLRFFVLDEADRLLADHKKDPCGHLNTILKDYAFKESAAQRQTIMTSATFDSSVEAVAAALMKPAPGETDIVRIVLSHGRISNRVNLVFHQTHTKMEKQDKLKEILRQRNEQGQLPKTLIFVQKKVDCDFLASKLQLIGQEMGFEAQTLHGDRGQHKRDEIIGHFKTGGCSVLVTTDVLSRGIDVIDLERVINFDLPDGAIEAAADTFIHRSGRTGRMHSGVCHSFVDANLDARLTPKLVEIVKSKGSPNAEAEIPEWLARLARESANQVFPDSFSRRGVGGRGGQGSFNVQGSFNSKPSGGFGSSGTGFGGGFGSSSAATGGGFGASSGTMGGGFGAARAAATSNDEPASSTINSGFGAPKVGGFGSAGATSESADIPSFESQAAQNAKAALESATLASATFGSGNDEEKKEETGEEEDDDW